jgi:N-acetyl-gamma-glutamyl-phosphate reductase
MIRTGIIGGAGYTAGELCRILYHHPQASVEFVSSQSQKGRPIHEVHTDFKGEWDKVFSGPDLKGVDVIFLCMGHGKSAGFLQNHNLPSHVRVIDLSHDFRLKSGQNDFVYGLPELNRKDIIRSHKIANPGCFATAIELALLPLAKDQLLKEDVHVHAITGSTGAGQSLQPTGHFSWRNNNISVYKVFQHQHLAEINQCIKQWQPNFGAGIRFVPVRGNFSRGILASLYTRCDLALDDIYNLFQNYYESHPFVTVSEENIDLKQVVNTNKGLLHVEKHDGHVYIASAIDNLLKGASGQAVQNMNLMFGLPENTGLKLKPVYF